MNKPFPMKILVERAVDDTSNDIFAYDLESPDLLTDLVDIDHPLALYEYKGLVKVTESTTYTIEDVPSSGPTKRKGKA